MYTFAERKLLMLRPTEIIPAGDQPRRVLDKHALSLLADSIASSGILEPLPIRKNADGAYELIAGERRLMAAKMAGLRRVPCILHRIDDMTADFYAVTENLQRAAPGIFEEAESIRTLMERYGLSQGETAIRLGLAETALQNKLELLRLRPEIRRRIAVSGLSERHARALLRLETERQTEALDRIIAEGLTLRETNALVNAMLTPPEPASEETAPLRKIAIGDLRLFTNSLYKLIDTIQNAGINAEIRKHETETSVEYKIKISKESLQSGCRQLKIC